MYNNHIDPLLKQVYGYVMCVCGGGGGGEPDDEKLLNGDCGLSETIAFACISHGQYLYH